MYTYQNVVVLHSVRLYAMLFAKSMQIAALRVVRWIAALNTTLHCLMSPNVRSAQLPGSPRLSSL